MEDKIKAELMNRGMEIIDRLPTGAEYKAVYLGWGDECDELYEIYIVDKIIEAMKKHKATKIMLTVDDGELDALIVL
jgi:hypothetical protein